MYSVLEQKAKIVFKVAIDLLIPLSKTTYLDHSYFSRIRQNHSIIKYAFILILNLPLLLIGFIICNQCKKISYQDIVLLLQI